MRDIDPRDPFLSPEPEQWQHSISERNKRWLASLPIIQTDAQKLRKRDILRQMRSRRWFLIRNVHGFKCTRCSTQYIPVVHEFITVACKPCPFNGLSEPHAKGEERNVERGSIRGMRVTQEDNASHAKKLGMIEPITRTQADVYADQIRERTRGTVAR